jgi:hypothetical protein
MSGPYRTRLVPPETFEPFWRGIDRRRAFKKRLPPVVAVLALMPTLAVPLSTEWAEARPPAPEQLQKAMAHPMSEPFGLVVSAERVRERRGSLPPGVPPPSLEAGTVSVTGVQDVLFEQAADSLRSCYSRALVRSPELTGDVVVSVAVAPEHEPLAVITGAPDVRRELSACLLHTFEGVRYPRPQHEPLWFHYPLRFERAD